MKGFSFKLRMKLAVLCIPKGVIYCAVFPLVMVIRLLRPLLCVRFIPIRERIGHAAANMWVYLAEQRSGTALGRMLDVFYPVKPVANTQLLKMWRRDLFMPWGARWVARLNIMLPGGEAHQEPGRRSDRDIYGLATDSPVPVSFSVAEREQGQQLLTDMGLLSRPFICLHVRDNAYLKHYAPHRDCSYHDYRDADVNNYVLAAKDLSTRGNAVVRMGSVVKDRFPGQIAGVIDYPYTPWRSDFADIYLVAQCRFMLGSNSGLDAVAMLFKKPLVIVNFAPLGGLPAWSPDYLLLPKKYWLTRERRFMKFAEVMNSGLAYAYQTNMYIDGGVEVVENTAEEILDAATEMDARLAGTWKTTDDYESLQKCFWGLYRPNSFNQVFRARIGSKFLAQNRDLLPFNQKTCL